MCLLACVLQRKSTQKLLSISWNGVRLNLKFYQKYRISQRNQGNLVLRSIKHRLQNPIKFGIDDPGQNTSNGNGIGRCDVFFFWNSFVCHFSFRKKRNFFNSFSLMKNNNISVSLAFDAIMLCEHSCDIVHFILNENRSVCLCVFGTIDLAVSVY